MTSLLRRTSLLVTGRRTDALASHPIFAGIHPGEAAALIATLDLRTYAAGAVILREGEPADALFVIAAGRVAVFREDGGELHELKRLGVGALFGEAGIFLAEVRSATVRAVDETRLLRLPYDALRSAGAAAGSVGDASAAQILRNLGEVVARRVNDLNDESIASLRERLRMADFFVGLTCLLAAYTFGLSLDQTFEEALRGYGPMISIGMLAAIAVGSGLLIRRLGWSLDRFGVHLRDLGPTLREAAAVSAAVMALLTAGKWLLITLHPDFAGAPLFGLGARVEMYGYGRLALLGVTYSLFSPIQEFIARGVLQTSLEEFVSFERRTLAAVLISNLLFAALHLHTSYTLAGLAFVSGLLWGWMYSRHRSLIGVSLSHVVIGLYAIYVLSSTPL